MKDLNDLYHASNNPKGYIYSIIEESASWNNNIAVGVQYELLDKDLERQDWKIQISVDTLVDAPFLADRTCLSKMTITYLLLKVLHKFYGVEN